MEESPSLSFEAILVDIGAKPRPGEPLDSSAGDSEPANQGVRVSENPAIRSSEIGNNVDLRLKVASAQDERESPMNRARGGISSEDAVVNDTSSVGSSESEESSRPNTPRADAITGLDLDLGRLVSLMEEQISLLRRIDERQAASDLSQQPMPEVSATSNSSWGALLRTTVAETIQPKVDRWRSGLDALLVFLGLFSAIVTAFLVDSLSGLRPDEAVRTNELLANLTDILITLSGANPLTLNLSTPAQFQPDPTDVRLNSYWSLSLILSLSVAALAVTCRGFLNMVTLSRHAKATEKLIDIKMRWKKADQILGPVIEIIPQLLVIPVLLFVVGLLDNIFSDVLQLAVLPTPVVATTSLSCFFITGVVAFLGYSLYDGSPRPRSSPFQSTLATFISTRILPRVQSLILWLQAQTTGLLTLCLPLHTSDSSSSGELPRTTTITPKVVAKHYHETVQDIHDDDTLDKASAALSSVLDPQRPSRIFWREEIATLVHLLSPEASIRANRTAAAAIAGFDSFVPRRVPQTVIIALAHAARRSVGSASLATLTSSSFLAALVTCLVGHGDPGPEHPPLIRILGSEYASLEHRADSKPAVISLMCDIIRSSPIWIWYDTEKPYTTTAAEQFRPAAIRTTVVLQALSCTTVFDLSQRVAITEILIDAKTARSVIQDAFEVLELLLDNSFEAVWMVEVIARVALARDNVIDELLGDLCVSCILNTLRNANSWFDYPFHGGPYSMVKVLTQLLFRQADSANGIGESLDIRMAAEFFIETKALTQVLPTVRRVMGQAMPMSDLAQILLQMSEVVWLRDFDIDPAIVRAQDCRNC